MKKFSIILLHLIFSVTALAQPGNYFLSNFSPDTDLADNVCFDIAQDDRGVFYFATQAGILQYDGRSWDVIPTNGAAYAVELAENGSIYVAGPKGFGKIAPDDNGLESFQLLYDKPGSEYIFQITTVKDKVYFLNERNLFVYSTVTDSTTTFSSSAITGAFAGLTEIFGSIYVSTENQGLFREANNKLTKSKLALPDSSQLVFSSRYKNKYLLGTSDSRLFLYSDKMRLKELVLKEPGYANASVIVNATWVSESLIALGTLRGGVIFINPETGSTTEITNYSKGLPDNEIYAIVCDKDKNVWAAHTYGYTRIAPFLPFRSFKHYPGLQGNLLCSITYQGNVYVGTSLGLYKLEKEDSYDEITYYVSVPVKSKKDKAAPVKTEKEEPEKKGFFSFLKRKKPETTTAKSNTNQPAPSQKKVRYKKEKRTKKILRSRYYTYKKVNGINAKITQLVRWQNKLIAAGLEGAFEITQLTSSPVLEDPVRFLLASERNKTLFVSTYDDKLHQLSVNKNTWNDENLIQNIDDPINYIFEEGNEAIWFCSYDKIYRLEYDDGLTHAAQSMNVVNPSFEKTVGVSLNGQVIIATSAGFYFYDKGKNALVKSDTLTEPKAYFANNSNLWFRDEHQWYISGNSGNKTNLQLLNLFNDIRYISSDDKSSNVWIITGNNELLRFNNDRSRSPIETVYPLFLKNISQGDAISMRRSSIEVEQENSSLKVSVVKPDYIGSNAVEYRYYLEGLHTEWSAWSNKDYEFVFPYLPPGEYTLKVQSKDIFGKESEMEPVYVNVVPPYWKRPWFYALEFAVFGTLVLLSFRLSQRYNLVSRLLSLLSIIILIEFIQTAAGSQISLNGGPFVDFLIQVFVAFLVLPVEGFLRTFMMKSIEKKKQARNKV